MVKHASTSEAFCPGDAEGAICRLEECIRGNYCKGTAGWGVVRETAHEVAVAEADRPVSHDTDLIEVAFRAVLAGIVQEALGKGEDVLDEEKFGLRALLDLALDLAQAGREEQGPGLGLRSVFFLLEDIFELLGVEQIQSFWPEVEKRESALFGLFKTARKSNLTMLKLCNSLLRKLSKGHNTAICGRIMMYLSRNWELSDPSAINKGGMANLSNKTAFEEPEDFARQQAREAEKTRRDEELRVAVEGRGGKEGGEEVDEEPIDYSLYKTFWGLQEHVSDPARLLQSEEAWSAFLRDAKVVLQAFEGFTVSEEAVATLLNGEEGAGEEGGEEGGENGGENRNRAETEGEERKVEEEGEGQKGEAASRSKKTGLRKDGSALSPPPSPRATHTRRRPPVEGGREGGREDEGEGGHGRSMEAFLGCKYLTNSRLFRLQLHDPLIRTQVLTQLLIVLNYASAATALAVASPPASSSPAPNPSPPKKGANDLVKHARRLIRNTSAQGAVYLGVLDTVLHREQAWLSWKRLQRCEPRIEKPPAPPARTVRTMEAVRQALAGAGKPSGVVAQQQKAFYGRPLPVPRPVNLAEVEAEVGEAVGRTFENYVRPRMEEAEDPEACIDEEYHPRHEPVFCWRAMRLGWAADARVLVGMENASLDALCRKMKGEDGEEDGGGEGKGKEEGRRKRKRKENGEAGAEQEVMHGT